jgi:hypothetical protein
LGSCFWELINEVSRGGRKNHGSLVWINFIIAKWWSYGFFNHPHSWSSFFVVVLVLWFLACQNWLVTFNGVPSEVLLWRVLSKSGSCYWLNNLSSFWKDPMAIYAFFPINRCSGPCKRALNGFLMLHVKVDSCFFLIFDAV